jgi:hypothetical protein
MLLTGKAHHLEVLTASLDFLGVSDTDLFITFAEQSSQATIVRVLNQLNQPFRVLHRSRQPTVLLM